MVDKLTKQQLTSRRGGPDEDRCFHEWLGAHCCTVELQAVQIYFCNQARVHEVRSMQLVNVQVNVKCESKVVNVNVNARMLSMEIQCKIKCTCKCNCSFM